MAPANSITAPTPSASAAASQSHTAAATVGYNEFLQLLVTEMQHQDPTNPMDPTQTVSQLASFSSVEQALRTNSILASLLDSSALSQASSVVGKTIASADGSISGVVVSVATSDQGATATLANGKTVQLTTGISIST
ncbi:MAG: flagellar hook assembly protein FlgD [Methylocystis sp.]|nr:flagellar hook assembly protein FlgD [Methylocystis sp.]